MSYEIIKSIRIKDGKVFINCASNNVSPRDYIDAEAPYFTKILQDKGETEVDIEIMKAYEEGSFQGGSNKYVKALKILHHMPEYNIYDWRNSNYEATNERRKSPEFRILLIKALNTKMPKGKYIVRRIDYPFDKYYVSKVTSRHIKFGNKENAKLFCFKEEAERVASLGVNSKMEVLNLLEEQEEKNNEQQKDMLP